MLQSKGVLLIAISMACDKKVVGSGWYSRKESQKMYESCNASHQGTRLQYLYLLCIPPPVASELAII
jgi:hypothetical protein